MTTKLLKDIYPVYVKEFEKNNSVDSIISYFENLITEHPSATKISIFDQYEQVKNNGGEILESIIGAKNIIFCFGEKLDIPIKVAIRPRSIAIVETQEKYIISFMEVPNPKLNDLLKEWVNKAP